MKFTWTEEMKTTFCSLKEAIINITSLYIPDPKRPFEIFGDVSEQRNALGGALMQQDPCVGWLRPVVFASRTLTKEERNYPIREKELLAAIFLLKHWRPYVSETITVWMDHESLKTLDLTASYAEARGRVRRWMSFLQELGVKLKYLPGVKNIRGLHKLVGTRLMMSSSGHPQTDGQSEIYNRTLETMLRCFCGDYQSEWPKLLPLLEFACISSTHSGLKATPHTVLYGFEARTFPSLLVAGRTATAAKDFHLRRQAFFEKVKERLERANKEAKRKADQKRREATFVPGDWALVHQKFFESERLPFEAESHLVWAFRD
uniref:Reverse transcriptase/retrotransposon-derived protein RNase H-like domain-containing protein n=1 Tax=Chromera velia CCMP2878 TaxID=1169474 RepID=A0A0K6S6B1_9ALVE|eukprot:Cvel_15353.t1-p1 / transcript=Cvel_15353.t1 / gene=Cvel_15353 / organism=Chromera_velia_CCMP2878 / gene_product=Retrovirus-related Pol polyprotein from transposon, putative / transcript_product=Retrovirus-related Pol polyprotein from transposon, putative / location=Cvel_scaffold1130:35126-36076(+) / protein_length=317 / sequence_SO=supercontig / SO=protein_coding / is_pseudo=false